MAHGLPWFKFNTTDWLEGTAGLKPEEKGTYVDLLCRMYERDGPLPDNDKLVAHLLYMNVRVWRRIKASLIATGKIKVTSAGIVNDRAMAEINERRLKSKKASAAVEKRWHGQATEAAGIGEYLPNDRQTFANCTPVIPEREGKKFNQNNGRRDTDVIRPKYHIEKEIENKSIPPTPRGGTGQDLVKVMEAKPASQTKAKMRRSKVNVAPDYTPEFEEVWKLFPRNRNATKEKAFDAWCRVAEDERPQIKIGAQVYAADLEQEQREKPWKTDFPIMHLSTYINRGKFREDSAKARAKADPYSHLRDIPIDEWHQRLMTHANGSWNFQELGPPPGRQDALVPDEALEKVNIRRSDYDDDGLRVAPGSEDGNVHH